LRLSEGMNCYSIGQRLSMAKSAPPESAEHKHRKTRGGGLCDHRGQSFLTIRLHKDVRGGIDVRQRGLINLPKVLDVR